MHQSMKLAGVLLASTCGFALLVGQAAAADVDTGCLPAVSGINGKLEASGGYVQGREYEGDIRDIIEHDVDGARFQGVGTLDVPLGCAFGFQLDVAGGSFDGDGFGGIGGHLFYRDPTSYLLGIQAQYINLGGDAIYRIGPEAELYLGNLTLSAMGAWEHASSFETDNFTGQLEAAYYLNDNFKLSAGYRHFLDIDAGAAGLEFKPADMPASVFVDAMVGTHDYAAVTAGIRFQLGGGKKSLIDTHRQDDPGHYFNLLNRSCEDASSITPDSISNTADSPTVVDSCGRSSIPKKPPF